MSVKFYDDGGSTFYAYGNEYGLCRIIRCDDESSAYEIAIDESPTIEPDELIEAYGFYLMQACRYNDHEGKKTAMSYISEHEIELIEGYQYQSNASGTGIVSVSHHEWLREATDSEIAQIGDDELADYLEDYGNELIDEHKWVMLNGWNGSISSMTYALQSSGELRRGSINRDDSQLEHVQTLWGGLVDELKECVAIALKAANANYENKCDDCLECKEWIGTDGRSHCNECGFDPAGDDYHELNELLESSKKVVARIDVFRDILEGNE